MIKSLNGQLYFIIKAVVSSVLYQQEGSCNVELLLLERDILLEIICFLVNDCTSFFFIYLPKDNYSVKMSNNHSYKA